MKTTISSPEQSFECSEYFHLARLCKTAVLIYGLAYKITSGGSRPFHAAAGTIASYLGMSAHQVRRGLNELAQAGFLVLEDASKFQPNVYSLVPHTQWQSKHPGKCCTKIKASKVDGDPLAVELWNITGGKVAFRQNQIDNYRKLGHSDQEVVATFKTFWEQDGRRVGVRIVPTYFYQTLAALSPNEHGEQF